MTDILVDLNPNFARLGRSYLFSEIARRVEEEKKRILSRAACYGAGERIISLGIGDVSLPLSKAVAREMARASLEMGTEEGFVGYGDTHGERSLREAICSRYGEMGALLDVDEIFVSDGAKGEIGDLNELFGDVEELIISPAYPVYLDASIISGKRIRLLYAKKENGFLPSTEELDPVPRVIHLCSPNNPTGAVFNREALSKWVDFARESGSLIVFDAAYESFISSSELPHSIFEIEGARDCAIEICSFSKMAGFTGVRCGWTAIARENRLYGMWKRRQGARFNGACQIAQRGAIAALSEQGRRECEQSIAYYMENAKIMGELLRKRGVFFTGGVHAPYLWMECPRGESSWHFFDRLLREAHVVCTPGVGFGESGEGFVRLSSFARREDIVEAMARLDDLLEKILGEK